MVKHMRYTSISEPRPLFAHASPGLAACQHLCNILRLHLLVYLNQLLLKSPMLLCLTAVVLQGLRDITTQEGALLCFDEVMTGFRIAKGCAQEHFGITPDLTTMGKVRVPASRAACQQ
jgi:hypothetical protein